MIANLVIALCSLAGFICLALAMDRHRKQMLRFKVAPAVQRVFRPLGWILLAVALALSIHTWGISAGQVGWLGWLTVMAMAFVFYLPSWPWQPPPPKAVPRRANAKATRTGDGKEDAEDGATDTEDSATTTAPRPLHTRPAAILLIVPVAVFAYFLADTPTKPVLRDDAIKGSIGPWSYTIAEENKNPPTIVAADNALKSFELRFCDSCDSDIRAAYLRVRKPRSLRTAGTVFSGARWTRWVEIHIPPSSKPEDQIWLTVEAKDGSVHHAALDIERLSPQTARFMESNR